MAKILYLVSEDWFFCSHFLPMARAAKAMGLAVSVGTRLRQDGGRIEAEGFQPVSIEAERGSLGPLEILRGAWRMAQAIRAEQPDIVHCISIRTVLIGGLVAKLLGVPRIVLAPTGLGHVWIDDGLKARLVRGVTRFVVGKLLRGARTHFLFENADDPREFGLDPHGSEVTLVGGAGVDPTAFALLPEPAGPVKVAVVARMLKPKGIAESVAAVQMARAGGAAIELHLFGGLDPSNPTGLNDADMALLTAQPGVVWHGRSEDVAAVWRDHHICLLLSYREGLPRSLVEAAACGRPIVASDVTGCREVVEDGVNGLLVPLNDAGKVAQALAQLAGDPALRAAMGAAGRARFEARFTESAVQDTVRGLYVRLIG